MTSDSCAIVNMAKAFAPERAMDPVFRDCNSVRILLKTLLMQCDSMGLSPLEFILMDLNKPDSVSRQLVCLGLRFKPTRAGGVVLYYTETGVNSVSWRDALAQLKLFARNTVIFKSSLGETGLIPGLVKSLTTAQEPSKSMDELAAQIQQLVEEMCSRFPDVPKQEIIARLNIQLSITGKRDGSCINCWVRENDSINCFTNGTGNNSQYLQILSELKIDGKLLRQIVDQALVNRNLPPSGTKSFLFVMELCAAKGGKHAKHSLSADEPDGILPIQVSFPSNADQLLEVPEVISTQQLMEAALMVRKQVDFDLLVNPSRQIQFKTLPTAKELTDAFADAKKYAEGEYIQEIKRSIPHASIIEGVVAALEISFQADFLKQFAKVAESYPLTMVLFARKIKDALFCMWNQATFGKTEEAVEAHNRQFRETIRRMDELMALLTCSDSTLLIERLSAIKAATNALNVAQRVLETSAGPKSTQVLLDLQVKRPDSFVEYKPTLLLNNVVDFLQFLGIHGDVDKGKQAEVQHWLNQMPKMGSNTAKDYPPLVVGNASITGVWVEKFFCPLQQKEAAASKVLNEASKQLTNMCKALLLSVKHSWKPIIESLGRRHLLNNPEQTLDFCELIAYLAYNKEDARSAPPESAESAAAASKPGKPDKSSKPAAKSGKSKPSKAEPVAPILTPDDNARIQSVLARCLMGASLGKVVLVFDMDGTILCAPPPNTFMNEWNGMSYREYAFSTQLALKIKQAIKQNPDKYLILINTGAENNLTDADIVMLATKHLGVPPTAVLRGHPSFELKLEQKAECMRQLHSGLFKMGLDLPVCWFDDDYKVQLLSKDIQFDAIKAGYLPHAFFPVSNGDIGEHPLKTRLPTPQFFFNPCGMGKSSFSKFLAAFSNLVVAFNMDTQKIQDLQDDGSNVSKLNGALRAAFTNKVMELFIPIVDMMNLTQERVGHKGQYRSILLLPRFADLPLQWGDSVDPQKEVSAFLKWIAVPANMNRFLGVLSARIHQRFDSGFDGTFLSTFTPDRIDDSLVPIIETWLCSLKKFVSEPLDPRQLGMMILPWDQTPAEMTDAAQTIIGLSQADWEKQGLKRSYYGYTAAMPLSSAAVPLSAAAVPPSDTELLGKHITLTFGGSSDSLYAGLNGLFGTRQTFTVTSEILATVGSEKFRFLTVENPTDKIVGAIDPQTLAAQSLHISLEFPDKKAYMCGNILKAIPMELRGVAGKHVLPDGTQIEIVPKSFVVETAIVEV